MATRRVYERFTMEALLGRDRFGSIYAATDSVPPSDGCPARVTLRLLPAGLTRNRAAVELFRRDFARVREFRHPNAPRLIEFGHDGEICFMTTELLDGETLRSVLSHLQPETLDESEADHVIETVGDVLIRAHERGIVHGDVRSESVLVTTDHEIKLLNLECTALTLAGPISQRPAEDVRALARMAYELYTDERLADEPTSKQLRRLPRRKARAIQRALAAEGDRNPQMREFLADADLRVPHWVAIEAADPMPVQRPRRTGRSSSVAASLVVVVAGITAYLVGGEHLQDGAPTPDTALRAVDGGEPGAEETSPSVPAVASYSAGELGSLAARVDDAAGVGPVETSVFGIDDEAAGPAAAEDSTRMPVEAPSSASGPVDIAFSAEELTAYESRTPLAIAVHRTGDLSEALEFAWRTRDGTARDGDDYARFDWRRDTFPPGERTRTLYVPIAADGLPESTEEFFVDLVRGSRELRATDTITSVVVIIDDDG